MTNLVDRASAVSIVGIARHETRHYARAVSADNTVYILHSQECLDSGIDLRDCQYSLALDNGIFERFWRDRQDIPVRVTIRNQRLVPISFLCKPQ